MKFVISGAFQPPQHLVKLAIAAEEAGYEALTFSDHVVYPETLDTPYPYTEDGVRRYDETSQFPDPWVVVGALSAVTTRLRFTTNAFVLPLRNPFVVAKQLATAAALSNDRITLTIGVGWSQVEFELAGQEFKRRGKRADEMLELMRKLWSGDWVEFDGEFYQCRKLKMTPPVPTRPIPVWVGGISDMALRRAARNDGWLSDLQTSDEIIECIGKIREYRRALGKPPECPVLASASDAHDLDGYRRIEEGGVTHVLTMPWAFYHGLTDDIEKKVDGIKRYAEDVVQKMA
ncbi:MAG: LLM class F420-dependent oxidoreductase [Spirochaetaceae bacterium]|nr:LLM class F420-dependent oxidoreductase [Myxococcales bacterium]MCB9725001.1 LLM class F420-dependent oxidoreductase [Spirochaetaceae bacterium]HPG27537.1 LLM class F420-dependent oxidoreductase [Myxococcota bacterium]